MNDPNIYALKRPKREDPLRASVTQSTLRDCVFVLKQFLAFGWRVYRTFRILYRAALAFQQADMHSCSLGKYVTGENNSRSDFVVNVFGDMIAPDRSIDRSIDLDGHKTRAATSRLGIKIRQKQAVTILTSSSLMSLEKTTQDLTLQSTRIQGSITARSTASTDVDGRKTRIATY